jgi:type II secretory pathway pseudopilin PulG
MKKGTGAFFYGLCCAENATADSESGVLARCDGTTVKKGSCPLFPRAFTLIEVLIWFVLLAVVMGMLGWFLINIGDKAREIQRDTARAEALTETLGRVGRDVRCASRLIVRDAAPSTDAATLVLEMPDVTRVVYVYSKGLLTRDATEGERTAAVPVARIEGLTFAFDKGRAAKSRWVEIRISDAGAFRFYLLAQEGKP